MSKINGKYKLIRSLGNSQLVEWNDQQFVIKQCHVPAQAIASQWLEFEHDNMARVVDVWSEGNDTWLAREYVEGLALPLEICEREFNHSDRLNMVEQVLSLFEDLHMQGRYHGNIKAENLIWNWKKRKWVLVDFQVQDVSSVRDLAGLGGVIETTLDDQTDIRWQVWANKLQHGDFNAAKEASRGLMQLGIQLHEAGLPDPEGLTWCGKWAAAYHYKRSKENLQRIPEEEPPWLDWEQEEQELITMQQQDIGQRFRQQFEESMQKMVSGEINASLLAKQLYRQFKSERIEVNGRFAALESLEMKVVESIITDQIAVEHQQQFLASVASRGAVMRLQEELSKFEKASQAAQRVVDIEKKIDEEQSFPWWERAMRREKIRALQAQYTLAIDARESILPKLIPATRGFLDADKVLQVAVRASQDKQQEYNELVNTWESILPTNTVAERYPIPFQSLEQCFSKQSFTHQSYSWDMHLLPATSFPVLIAKPVWVAVVPVVQCLYSSVMGENPSVFQGAERPVEMVSWFEAVQFCNKLSTLLGLEEVYTIEQDVVTWLRNKRGFRLPTEAEWRHAATCEQNYRYAGSDQVDEVAWYLENSEQQTHSVGQKKSNDWGLLDMCGNVEEWCWDIQTPETNRPENAEVDEPAEVIRVRCGGSWYHDERAVAIHVSGSSKAASKSDCLGFRLVYTGQF